jgi:hypothetical protein
LWVILKRTSMERLSIIRNSRSRSMFKYGYIFVQIAIFVTSRQLTSSTASTCLSSRSGLWTPTTSSSWNTWRLLVDQWLCPQVNIFMEPRRPSYFVSNILHYSKFSISSAHGVRIF